MYWSRSVRSAWITPLRSQTRMLSFDTPNDTSRLRHAIAAAPAPLQAIFASPIFRPVISSAFRMPAAVTIAVPCWSSWNTGIFIRAFSRFSISKQAGAEMSSRFIPPKVGSSRAIASTNSSTLVSSTSMSITSMPENFLNSAALPSITGFDASAPMLPRPSTAVPFEITATRLARPV